MATIKHKLILLVLFACGVANAQNFSVTATIDSTVIYIGSQTKLRFEIAQPKSGRVETPLFDAEIIEGVELLQRIKPDTIDLGSDRIQVNMDYIITSFDTASYDFPPYKFISGEDTVWSNPLSLKVYTVEVDTIEGQFFDIKPVYRAPFNWARFFTWFGLIWLGIVVLLLIYIIVRKFILKKDILPLQKPKEIIPPHVLALRELDRIKHEKLWQHGRIKEFHTQLTDVLRLYIEQRFYINAIEMTTDEIISAFSLKKEIDKEPIELLRGILQLADLVKFAKYMPFVSDNERSLSQAYTFVEQTKQEEEENE